MIRALTEPHLAGCQRCGGSARRASRIQRGVPWVARNAEYGVEGIPASTEFGCVGLCRSPRPGVLRAVRPADHFQSG